MAEKKKEELREKEERGRAKERQKKLEEESERRESQSKNSETASENLMDDRSRKWEDRRRLEREGDEIIKVLVKHEEKEAEERREKKEEERWARWEEKRERRTEERWAKWEDRQRLERQGDETVEMIRRHEEEEEEKRRQNEGMSAGDEYRMMLRMAENHVFEASKHREMVGEKAQKGINEAREKVVMEMGEMIENGNGNVTFGSERIRPGEYIERKKGELERSEAERGQAADRVLSRHLAEANRDEEERRIQGKGKSRNMAEERKGGEIARSMGEEIVSPSHDATMLKEMIVAAAVEEIDREETMTQATVVETMIVFALGYMVHYFFMALYLAVLCPLFGCCLWSTENWILWVMPWCSGVHCLARFWLHVPSECCLRNTVLDLSGDSLLFRRDARTWKSEQYFMSLTWLTRQTMDSISFGAPLSDTGAGWCRHPGSQSPGCAGTHCIINLQWMLP